MQIHCRTGTHYLSEVLVRSKYDLPHENIGTMGSVSWVYAVPYKEEHHRLEVRLSSTAVEIFIRYLTMGWSFHVITIIILCFLSTLTFPLPNPLSKSTCFPQMFFSNNDSVNFRASPEFQFFPVIHLVRHPLSTITSLTKCFCGCGSLR